MAQQRQEDIPTNPVQERIQEFENYDSQLEDGNPLFPSGYIPQIERQIEDKLRDIGIPVNEAMGQIGMLMHQTLHAQAGYRLSLERLAEEVVREMYGPLLDGVELDIQLCAPGEPQQQMGEPGEPPQMEQIQDEETRNEIYKRRVSNYLTSGAALATHRIIHMPEYRDRINQISPDLVEKYDQLLKLNEVLDGAIPIEDQERMWREMPEGMAGSVKVEWPEDNEEEHPEEEPPVIDAEEVVEVENEHTEEAAVQFEEGNEEVELPPIEEERDAPYTEGPIIHARGIDFPMLVHETVKGVYELIMANGIPEEEELARIVIDNADTYMQELVGHRVGPQLRQDLLDYVNEHEASNEYSNLLERVIGRIIALSGTEFVALANGILNRTTIAKGYIDELIHEIVEELKEFNLYQQFGEETDYEEEEPDEDGFLEPKAESETPIIPEKEPTIVTGPDYPSMSKTQLQAEMDTALDKEDWEAAREIGKHLEKHL